MLKARKRVESDQSETPATLPSYSSEKSQRLCWAACMSGFLLLFFFAFVYFIVHHVMCFCIFPRAMCVVILFDFQWKKQYNEKKENRKERE